MLQQVMAESRLASQEIRKLSVEERVQYITRLRKEVLSHLDLILDQIQKETHKSRSDAMMSEVYSVLDHLQFLEKESARYLSDRKVKTPIALMGKKSMVLFEPLGVVLVISPWNYPFYQSIVPCTLSFITGNATIYKPSEHTPLQGLMEGLFEKAGFSKSWIQMVYGDGAMGAELISLKPDKVFFTGSVKTGKKIMAQAAENLTPVELELGGKDPMIIFEDANLDRAASGALWGGVTNLGQSCTSVERIYVQESVATEFKNRLLQKVSKVTQSVDQNGGADVGNMTVDFQCQTIGGHLADAKEKGAFQLTGEGWDGVSSEIPPIVLEKVNHEMKIMKEETFGPVLPIMTFKEEEEAIRLANDSEYGLSASVWSKDQKRALRVARRLMTGNVSINNVMLTEGNHYLPFGGVKQSGIGRYKGEFGFYSFSNVKSVLIDQDSSKIEANWYPYTPEKFKLFRNMMVGLFSGGFGGFLKFLVNGLKLESYSNRVGRSKES